MEVKRIITIFMIGILMVEILAIFGSWLSNPLEGEITNVPSKKMPVLNNSYSLMTGKVMDDEALAKQRASSRGISSLEITSLSTMDIGVAGSGLASPGGFYDTNFIDNYPMEDLSEQEKEVLIAALKEKYRAKALHEKSNNQFGNKFPFSYTTSVIQFHISLLRSLFTKYNLEIPLDLNVVAEDYVDYLDSCIVSADSEIKSMAIYTESFKDIDNLDMKEMFNLLQWASSMHLRALQMCIYDEKGFRFSNKNDSTIVGHRMGQGKMLGAYDVDFENNYPIEDLSEQEKAVLIAVLKEKYKAKALHEKSINQFGRRMPFLHVTTAEQGHVELLKSLFTKYNLEIPLDLNVVEDYANFLDSCNVAVNSEIESITIYAGLLKDVDNLDIAEMLNLLQWASSVYLRTFQTCSYDGRWQ